MNVEELSVLHQRYVDLSHQFRAAWVFHQFIQSLRKVFEGTAGAGFADEFQLLYTELKEVSQTLTASEIESTRQRLDAVEERLGPLLTLLVEEDNKISPHRCRQFFLRFQRYDDKILLQLIRFEIYAAAQDGWGGDRIDKLDYLLTRISQEESESSGSFVLVERRKLREIFDSLWALSGADPPLVRQVEALQTDIGEIRAQLASIHSFDELTESALLDRFRRLKHGLGALLLEPDLLTSVLETNLGFKNLVQRLYRKEERSIVADYQQVFDLEGEVPFDVQLERELTDFRREIEGFERQLQQDDFRLGDLARIRSRVRTLLPRLQEASRPHARLEDPPSEGFAPRMARGAGTAPEEVPPEAEIWAAEMEEILEILEETDPDLSPRAVSLKPSVFPFRLEPREVLAFRRLHGRGGMDPAGDPELERFLLRGAALRVHVGRRVDDIRDLLNETYRNRDAPAVQDARLCLFAAETALDQYNQRVHQLLIEGRSQDARFIEILRVRMMREYSGLWLLVFKPLLESTAETPDSEES